MHTTLIFIYYTAITLVMFISILKFKQLDKALRSIAILLMLTVLSESLSNISKGLEQYGFRNSVYHIYSIVQLGLTSIFFIYAIRPDNYRRHIVFASIGSFTVGTLNIIFLQPLNKLNTFMLMFESFVIITMSLYYVYWLIKKDIAKNTLTQAHFSIALLLLVMWSSSFFFWAFIAVLYKNGWQYLTIVTNTHLIVNIIFYSGTGITLFYSGQKLAKHVK